ncbi:MAG: homocysteine S-methyltransferase family protein [Gammaproteobacteria bacterium]|nr:homocysteine S-methyltransferase family protein [Gammaproteobacteria bacterium]
MKAIREGEFVPMDGALGTELERRGVPMEGTGWSAFAVRDHGDVIREVHEDYIRAGAQLHIVNSFALARHVLEPIGLGDQFEYLNRQAVVLFDDAVANSGVDRHSLWVAGSMSTFAANSDRSLLPGDEVLVSNYRDQARILHDAGVDLFALEMLFDIDVSLAMFEAAAGFNLPIIMGFTCDLTDSSEPGVCTGSGMGYPGIPLEQVLRTVIDSIDTNNVIFSIMHSEADVTDVALKVLKTCWDGPVAIYPNSGQFVDLRMQFDSVCSPDEFQQAAGRWADAGVQIIGGCCGIGPTHIERLKESVHSWQGIR